jgi:hypothetical protein
MKDRQRNCQTNKDKMTKCDLQRITQKTNDRVARTTYERGFMSYLCYLCLFRYNGVQHILYCVFVVVYFCPVSTRFPRVHFKTNDISRNLYIHCIYIYIYIYIRIGTNVTIMCVMSCYVNVLYCLYRL